MTRVVVVEDHTLVRQSLVKTINAEDGFEVAGEAGFVNDWNLKVRFQMTSQSAKRLVHANELPGCKT